MSTDPVPDAGADPFDPPNLCRHFFERSPQPMAALEGATHVVRYVNPAFTRLLGRGAEDVVHRRFADAVPVGEGNGCLGLLDRVLHTGRAEFLAEQGIGQTPPAYWSYAAWAILGGCGRPAGVILQVADATESALHRRRAVAMNEALVISSVRQHELIDTIQQGEQERRELEAHVFRAQKMESLGVLAGGIAHDLNNILTPVIGYTELAAAELPEHSPAASLLEEVGKNARRAADLVWQVLAYAGKGRFVVQPVNLSGLVRDMGGLLAAAVAINTELEYDLATDLPAVEADATQLRQVVLNLVTNAAEAIGDGVGIITVRTGVLPASHPGPNLHVTAGEPRVPSVFLEVVDSGCGMTPDVAEKIFDPFFTTKFTGRGLGLAVVQGVARGHGGALEVRSEAGKGSTLRLLLPASTRAVAMPVTLPRPERWRGTGTVLVVDDEAGVRDLAARVLTTAGFTVLFAVDGAEGVSVYQHRVREIDAVVLDLTMPGLSGLEAAAVLRGMRPDLPVVLMSGYSVQELAHQTAGSGITEFVHKPFTSAGLLAAVRRALGQ